MRAPDGHWIPPRRSPSSRGRALARRPWPALAAAGLALAAPPGTALAGIASISGPDVNAPGGVSYVDPFNESNGVFIAGPGTDSASGFPLYTVREDRNTTPRVLPHCSVASVAGPPFVFRCVARRLTLVFGVPVNVRVDSFDVRLGGGNDALSTSDGLGGLVGFGMTTGFVSGGSGDDTLTTGRARTNDRIFGETGNDFIESAGGADVLRGGEGNDIIAAIDDAAARGADRVICDEGADFAQIDLLDVIPFPTCESVQRAAIDQHPTVRIARRAVSVRDGEARVRLSCPAASTADCDGRLALSRVAGARRFRLGAAGYRIARGGREVVSVPVSLAPGRRIRAEAVSRERDANGLPKVARAQVGLVS
jgi:Ca2+-binding RTX toxin-like protein